MSTTSIALDSSSRTSLLPPSSLLSVTRYDGSDKVVSLEPVKQETATITTSAATVVSEIKSKDESEKKEIKEKESTQLRRCDGCKKSPCENARDWSLKKCTRCRTRVYGSTQCQRDHWNSFHMLECRSSETRSQEELDKADSLDEARLIEAMEGLAISAAAPLPREEKEGQKIGYLKTQKPFSISSTKDGKETCIVLMHRGVRWRVNRDRDVWFLARNSAYVCVTIGRNIIPILDALAEIKQGNLKPEKNSVAALLAHLLPDTAKEINIKDNTSEMETAAITTGANAQASSASPPPPLPTPPPPPPPSSSPAPPSSLPVIPVTHQSTVRAVSRDTEKENKTEREALIDEYAFETMDLADSRTQHQLVYYGLKTSADSMLSFMDDVRFQQSKKRHFVSLYGTYRGFIWSLSTTEKIRVYAFMKNDTVMAAARAGDLSPILQCLEKVKAGDLDPTADAYTKACRESKERGIPRQAEETAQNQKKETEKKKDNNNSGTTTSATTTTALAPISEAEAVSSETA